MLLIVDYNKSQKWIKKRKKYSALNDFCTQNISTFNPPVFCMGPKTNKKSILFEKNNNILGLMKFSPSLFCKFWTLPSMIFEILVKVCMKKVKKVEFGRHIHQCKTFEEKIYQTQISCSPKALTIYWKILLDLLKKEKMYHIYVALGKKS